MTDIYQAYKKQVVGLPEMTERLQRAGSLRLFPALHELQQEEFAKLSHRLLSMKQDHVGSVLSVASSVSGEGASFVSYNLANFLGLVFDQKVIWIDGNFRSPQKKLMEQDGVTFADMLRRPALVEDLPCKSAHVTLVPGGSDLRDVRANFADRNYKDLIAGLASRYDFAIIDLPPVLDSQDAALMAQKTDGLLLVIAFRLLKRERIASGVNSLQEVGVKLLGAIMNRREFDLPKLLHKWI